MKTFLLLCSILLSVCAQAQSSIKPQQAKGYTGKNVTVCGKVVGVHVSKSGTSFLDFGATYPHEVFSAVIFAKDIQAYRQHPLAMYKGKSICVTGRIDLYQNKPGIVVENPAQIQ